MSDLAAVQDQLTWGLPPECDARPLCKGALEAYGITYPPKQREALAACDAPIATALENKGIDFGWLCSTQPAIAQFGYRGCSRTTRTRQPAENMTALVRDDLLAKVGDKAAFQAAPGRRAGEADHRGAHQDGRRGGGGPEGRRPDIAEAFLTAQGLLK